jgi:uncharacterized membrane protein YdjX (TVP38/TMEM64 family)
MTAPPRNPRGARLALVLVVVAGLLAAWRLGVFAQFAEPRKVADTLVAMGPWGYLAFVAAYTLLQPFGVPGTAFIVAAPLIWPWRTAFVLSMVGTMGASVVGFSFARFVARDWVAARVPARLRKYEGALERSGLRTVIVLRLLLWMPQGLHFFLGVSKVRFWSHFWGSLVGYIPTLLVVSYLGGAMFDASGRFQPNAWPAFAGLFALSVVVAVASRRLDRQRQAAPPA